MLNWYKYIAENQEISSIGEKHAKYVKAAVPRVEKDTAPHPLATKLGMVKEGVRTHNKRIELLSSIYLLSDEAKAILDPVPDESEEDQGNSGEDRSDVRGVARKLKDFGRLKGIKKVTDTFERVKLAQQRAELDKQAAKLHVNTSFEAGTTSRDGWIVTHNKKDAFASKIGQEIGAVRGEYQDFLGEVISEGTIVNEIQNAYINSVITPLVDDVAERRKIPDNRKEAFYTALKNCLKQDATEEEKQAYRQELERFGLEDGLHFDSCSCRPLLIGGDREIITTLIGKIAASDIAVNKEKIFSTFSSAVFRYTYQSVLYKAIYQEGGSGISPDRNLGSAITKEMRHASYENYPDMDLWSALTSSTTAN